LWLATGRWFSIGSQVFSTKKNDRRDIAEILLKLYVKHHNLNPNAKDHIRGYYIIVLYSVLMYFAVEKKKKLKK
jgi:hypothetical protein